MNNMKKWIAPFLIWCGLFVLLISNYLTNIMDARNNRLFEDFQKDSELLVTDMLLAERAGLEMGEYGLGFYVEDSEQIDPYQAQYGLQGKIFRHLSVGMPYDTAVNMLHFLCAAGMAITVLLIVYLIYRKYNLLMAFIFYITFLLSPWIVNFARNLYWVEFTWFLPMLIGLYCSYRIHSKNCRIFCYVAGFLTIAAKCLCGYEYISTIMLGLIAFLLIDFLKSVFEKDFKKSKLLFNTIFILGIFALLGFIAALCILGSFRGNGNILDGLQSIYKEDVLRRTLGGNVNDFPEVYRESLEAPIFEVLKQYFKFETSIIAGVSGKFFSFLCIVPMIMMAYDGYKKRMNVELVSMYIIFFITTISWFVLGKAHSAIHTHMNFVLWYFGLVQICFYIISNWFIKILKRER